MRVTQTMLSNNMLRNLMNSQTKMDKFMTQLYTGKKISRPSDDPVIAMKGIGFRGQVMEVEQYKRNLSEVHNWMDNSDAALDKANLAMQRIRELTVQASNTTYDDEALKSIKEEVEQLKDHLMEIVNTNVNGKYIFNGTNTTEAPAQLDEDGAVVIPDTSTPVEIELSKGSPPLRVNVKVEDVFTNEMFAAIDELLSKLEGGEGSSESVEIGNSLSDLDEHINNIINARADLGARMNRVELIEIRLDEQEVIAKKTMSENEDVDFEEAIINLITQETLHRAALSAGSRIIQPTLVDFLR